MSWQLGPPHFLGLFCFPTAFNGDSLEKIVEEIHKPEDVEGRCGAHEEGVREKCNETDGEEGDTTRKPPQAEATYSWTPSSGTQKEATSNNCSYHRSNAMEGSPARSDSQSI